MLPSAISMAVRQLRAHLAARLELQVGQILIGHPNAAYKETQSASTRNHLNLFVYQVEHGAYPSGGSSDEPLYVRLRCLVTPFADSDAAENGASAGENDLRLMGQVMQAMHEAPMLDLRNDPGDVVSRLQIVPLALNLDDLNHLWATQSDTPYRLSVAYELALVPLPVQRPVSRSPLVGATGLGVGVDDLAPEPMVVAAAVRRLASAATSADWLPQIAWRADGPRMVSFQALPRKAVPAALPIVLVGRPGETVTTAWSVWDAAAGWQALEAPESGQELLCSTAVADGDAGRWPPELQVALPATTHAQLQLHVQRKAGGSPTWSTEPLRSNPLLLSFYGPAA